MERTLLWPALSGGAILLERLSGAVPPAAMVEQITEGTRQEDQDGLLRR